MVDVGGRPILWHIMKIYAHHGLREFVLCLGYRGAVIKEYFLNYQAMNSDFTVELGRDSTPRLHGAVRGEDGWRVTLADTGEKAMTGARVARAARYLGDDKTLAVTYGDGVTDVNLKSVLAFHRSSGRLATVTGVRPPSRFGELVHSDGRVVTFTEKPQIAQGLINAASSSSSGTSCAI